MTAATIALVVSAAACSGSSDSAAAATTSVAAGVPTTVPGTVPSVAGTASVPVVTLGDVPPFEPVPIEWQPLDDAVDLGTLDVPVDYADPDGARFTLSLARYNALDQDNKIGTLLVNPGGPGVSGTFLATDAANWYDRELRERFDIVAWDPRGTGKSTPVIDCIDDYDEFYAQIDTTPEDDAERQAVIDSARRFADGCVQRSGDILARVGTNDSARDVDAIRRAIGEDTISFFGFSYGSELGATWATLFPDTVRAAVFDGGVDPTATSRDSTLQQYVGLQAALGAFLADCAADDGCAFHHDGDPTSAFTALFDRLDESPIEGAEGRPPVNRDVAVVAAIMATYSDQFWPTLAQSLAAAERGDGSGLLALYDAYFRRSNDGTWTNELEAFEVISCADSPESATTEQADELAGALHEVAPLLIPEGAVGGYTCAMLPPTPSPRIGITGAGAGPILVIGTTGDAATPLGSSRTLSDTLEGGVLLVVDAAQHTGYGANECVIDAVSRYLIDLTVPDDGTECS